MTKTTENRGPGDLDPAFGDGGIKLIDQPLEGIYQAHGLNLSANGNLLITGSRIDSSGDTRYYSLQRRTDKGNPDPTFGNGGFVDGRFTSDAGLSSSGLKTFTTDNSRLLLSGIFYSSRGEPLPAFAKFRPDGRADEEFGVQGHYVSRSPLPTEFGLPSNLFIDACIQSTNRVLSIHPHVLGPHSKTTLALRINQNGTQDINLNGGLGYIDTRPTGGETILLTAVTVQADDKILACGFTEDIRGIKTGIILRYQKDGERDTTFATRGEYRKQDCTFEHLVALEDRILCCGSTAGSEALLIELQNNGQMHRQPIITPKKISSRWTKLVWKDQKIVMTGEREGAFGGHHVVARLNEDRTFDLTFGNGNGWVAIEFGAQSSAPLDLVCDANQGIFVLVSVKKGIGTEEFVIGRLFA
jgi:uncharacterized delta-60 repeat protein